ncbi:MAG: hypothetical protein FJY54_10475 [Betaproteobacteria bacterium]|nr:hypothetical protein [Betaproteobacteria bacterium]
MNDLELVWDYVSRCAGGALALSECKPVWQLAVIALLLGIAVTALIVARLRSRRAGLARNR